MNPFAGLVSTRVRTTCNDGCSVQNTIMFGLFKKKTEKQKLEERYAKLTEEAYKLSHTDRTASDRKTAEAHEVLLQIEALEKT
jgi:hypothetical protein